MVELHRYNWRNTALEPELATLGGRIRVLPIFDLSARYPKVDQPKAADCTHFALPGLPDTWSHLLLATLAGAHTGKAGGMVHHIKPGTGW